MDTEINILPLASLIYAKGDFNDAKRVNISTIVPMRFFGTVTHNSPTEDELAVHWGEDPRDYETFAEEMKKYYDEAEEIGQLEVGRYYVILHNDEFLRCKLVKVMDDIVTVYLIDRALLVSVADAHFFDLVKRFKEGEYQFEYALALHYGDHRQAAALGLPPFTAVHSKKGITAVEVFLLSAYQPYLGVVGSVGLGPLKVREDRLVPDLQEMVPWQVLTATSMLDPEPSERNSPLLEPRWIHNDNFTSVVIAGMDSLERIYVRDMAAALRVCFLSEILADTYSGEVADSLIISDFDRIGINSTVIYYDNFNKAFYRCRVTHMNADGSSLDLIAIDFPDRCFENVLLKHVWLPSRSLDGLPAFVHTVSLTRGLGRCRLSHYSVLASMLIPVGTVVVVSKSAERMQADMSIRGPNNTEQDLMSVLEIGLGFRPASMDNEVLSQDPDAFFSNPRKFNWKELESKLLKESEATITAPKVLVDWSLIPKENNTPHQILALDDSANDSPVKTPSVISTPKCRTPSSIKFVADAEKGKLRTKKNKKSKESKFDSIAHHDPAILETGRRLPISIT